MTAVAESGAERDLTLRSGAIHVAEMGERTNPLVICVHGLSANHLGFERIAPALLRAGLRVVSPDLRGRARSPHSGPGTYGLPAHADDLVEIADQYGADRFSVVGWSLGALIGMQCAASWPGRLERLVMIDHADQEDDSTVALIERGLARLDAVFRDPDAYVEAIRAAGAARPWNDTWDRFYRYELSVVPGGVKAVTSREAALEDLAYLDQHDLSEELWPRLRIPTLLVRATVPLGGGLVVPATERDAFAAAVPSLQVVEVEANHYGVMTHPETIAAVADFLTPAGGRR